MSEGVRFGSYELRALLGTGGMARVYRAVRTGPMGFEKEVAVKILDPRATATQDQITALTDEARLGGLLRHPNIVATDELGQVGPNYYIAMELVDGWPLERLLKEHATRRVPIPRTIIVEVMALICDGLAYAHALTDRAGEPLQLVHRDMKPGNVMISRTGEVKIMDFGIAKATTNKYATAEQSTRGNTAEIVPRCAQLRIVPVQCHAFQGWEDDSGDMPKRTKRRSHGATLVRHWIYDRVRTYYRVGS